VAQFRAVSRLRAQCLQDSSCDSTSYAFRNFSRLLLKGAEHTWGIDVKKALKANGDYFQWSARTLALASPPQLPRLSTSSFRSNEAFAKVRSHATFQNLEESW
jgi:hypothetical protein